MDIIDKILSEVPLFRHCSQPEREYLKKSGTVSMIKKGSSFDLKKMNTVNVVINGFFEIEALGKKDLVYLSPGSFFGHVPFTDTYLKGSVKAVIDSNLITFKAGDIYRFFIGHFGAMKGYLNIISRMGFPLSSAASQYASKNSRVITVTSSSANSGKSLTAALISSSLKNYGRVIAVDMSFSGYSLFDYFNIEISPPFSLRRSDEQVNEEFISERVVPVAENLDLMNFSYGSKVKADPSILSPLLFFLSRSYEYIVLDISASDESLLEKALSVTASLVNVLKDNREIETARRFPDSRVSGFTSVMHLKNLYYEKSFRHMGGYLLEKIDIPEDSSFLSIETPCLEPVVKKITGRKNVLIVESNYFNSACLSGFFGALYDYDKTFDLIYTSAMSYLPASFFSIYGDYEEYKKNILHLFGDRGLARVFSVDFPEKFIFKSTPAMKYMKEFLRDIRVDSCETPVYCKLKDENTGYQFISCSGRMSDIAAASIAVRPFFERVRANGKMLSSGYPETRVRVEEIFRTDPESVFYLSVENRQGINPGPKVPSFFSEYISYAGAAADSDKFSDLADRNIILKTSESEMAGEKIFENSRGQSIKLLKESGMVK